MNKYRVLSLFSGAGGMDLGFLENNFEVVWANDFFSDAVNSYKKNIGDHIIEGDITRIDCSEMPDNIDVVIGGFPCQGFSIANSNRNVNDERNFLYKEMLRVIENKKPKIFVAENVKGILSLSQGNIIKMIQKDFSDLGYNVTVKLLNASEFGVPQMRERVIIIGNRIGVENLYPSKTHTLTSEKGLLPAINVKDVIGFLSEVELNANSIYVDDTIVHNHIASTNVADKFWGRKYKVDQHEICDYLKYYRDKRGLSTKKIDELFGYKHTAGHWFRKDNKSGSIPKPNDWWKLKEILKFDDKYDEKVTCFVEKEIKYEQSLRITNWDRPSDTITATSPEIHVNKKRRLSVRECAIIQTFPMEYEFQGSLQQMYKQIGNAVPVLLSSKIAKQIEAMLNLHEEENEK